MKTNVNLARNKCFHIENSMIMFGIYNAETKEKVFNAIQKIHNQTTWNEKLFQLGFIV